MKSVAFDRAAEIYDQTRGMPALASRQVAESLLRRLDPQASILEAGIGTGRIALPLQSQGALVAGVDLSRPMLLKLRQKRLPGKPCPDLAQADATLLPFRAHSFDVLVVVHVLHLIPNWTDLILEARRVLRPGGVFVTGYEKADPDSAFWKFRVMWHQRIDQILQSENLPGPREFSEVDIFLANSGASQQTWEGASWNNTFQPGDYLDSLRRGIYSMTWRLTPGQLEQCLKEQQSWCEKELGAMDRQFKTGYRFTWKLYQWS